jgi:hypothetical protein
MYAKTTETTAFMSEKFPSLSTGACRISLRPALAAKRTTSYFIEVWEPLRTSRESPTTPCGIRANEKSRGRISEEGVIDTADRQTKMQS